MLGSIKSVTVTIILKDHNNFNKKVKQNDDMKTQIGRLRLWLHLMNQVLLRVGS